MTTASSHTEDQATPVPHKRDDYSDLVLSALRAAAFVLAIKVVAVVALAKAVGATSNVGWWAGVVPHFAFSTTPDKFSTIVTWSTIAMASAALLLASITVAKTATTQRQLMWGRLVAGVVALETLALQIFRQRDGGPDVQWQWSWIVIVTACAGIALIAIPLWTERAQTHGQTSLSNNDEPADMDAQL